MGTANETPESIVIRSTVNVWNPDKLAWTAYVPGSNLGTLHWPPSSVTAVLERR